MYNIRSDVAGSDKHSELCLNKANFKHITLRRRNQQRDVVQFHQDDFTDDEDNTFFGIDIGSSEIVKPVLSLKETHPSSNLRTKNGQKRHATPRNDTYTRHNIEAMLASKPQSTPRASKCFRELDPATNSSCHETCTTKSKKSSKSLFSNYSDISKCCSCKNSLKRGISDADSSQNSDKVSCLKCNSKKSKRSIGCNFSVDSNYSRYFQPPCSSTKMSVVCPNTPIGECSVKKPNVPMSGVKELRTPILSKQNHCASIKPSHNVIVKNDDKHDEDMDIDDDIPCTQPISSIILRDVVAFVDVKIGNITISDNVKSELSSLGAAIEEKFTKKVTHVIFRDGTFATYKKAKRWKIPLVSIVWLNECKKSLTLLPTEGFDPPGLENYEKKVNRKSDKDLFDVVNTKRKQNTGRKRRIEMEIMKQLEAKRDATPRKPEGTTDHQARVQEASITPPNNGCSDFNLLREFIGHLASDVQEVINRSESPTEDFHIPVPVSLIRKCISPRKVKTDIKDLLPRQRSTKIHERRKNLDELLKTSGGNVENKENNCKDHLSERRSAPSELLSKPYKKINSGNNDKQNKAINNRGKRKRKNLVTPSKNENDDCQPLTQTKKRQLLPLGQPENENINELINDISINNSVDPVIKNPYGSPKLPSKSQKALPSHLSQSKNSQKRVTSQMALRSGLKPDPESSKGSSRRSSRRSSSQLFVSKKHTRKDKFLPSIVFTGFINKDNVGVVTSIVETLGRFEIERNVSSRTSHVIVERENFRTLNLLKGISRGCWIVHFEWAFASLEANKWISEEKFEITSFSPAVRVNRYDRQAFGPEYECDLFKECGAFYVSPKCNPPTADVKELITLCGGRLVNISRAADIIVGGYPSLMHKCVHVAEKWVLDCITEYRVLEFGDYSLHELELK